jgi:hypothetical protein
MILGIMIPGIGEPLIIMDLILTDIITGMDIEITIGDGNIDGITQDTTRTILTIIILGILGTKIINMFPAFIPITMEEEIVLPL